MALASSIGKQIAPGVYEDANYKPPYRATPTTVPAPTVTPTTNNPLSTTSSASKNVTNQITQPKNVTYTNQSQEMYGSGVIKPQAQSSSRLGTPKKNPITPTLGTTQAGQPGGTIVDPKLQYFDDVSKSIGYADYSDYQTQTGQNLDSIAPLYDANQAMTGDTKFAEQRGAEVATALQNFTYAKNQSEARMLAMGTDIINGPEILKEQEKIGGLINKGITDPMQIGQILGMDAKKVTDLINGKIEPYVSLSDEAYNDSNADNIQRNLDYQNQKYENDKTQGFEQLRRLEEDYTKQSQEQMTQNKIADGNLSILARMTGVGFSNRGIMGMDEVMRQGQRILADMSTQYDRSSADTRNYLNQLAQAYTYNNAELIDSLNQSIDATKQGYFTAIQAIRTQFGDATVETEKQVKQAMVNFASDIDKYYEDVNAQMKQNFDMANTNYQNAVANEQTIYQRQQDSITNYKDASFSMTSSQILADESLTPQQKKIVIAQQQQSAVNYLGKLSVSGVARPEDIARMQTLLANPNVTPEMAVGQIVKDNPTIYGTQAQKQEAPKVEKVIDPRTGKEKSIYWDEETQGRKDVPSSPEELIPNGSLTGKDVSSVILSGNVSTLAASMEEGKAYDCGTRSQCGERYNDAVGIKNGTRVGNTYADKTKFVDPSIQADQATEGMGVVFNPGGDYQKRGHVGVLASGLIEKNGQAGYEVLSANYSTSDKLSKDFVPLAKIAASGGGFIPTNAKEESKQPETLDDNSLQNLFDEYNRNHKLPAKYVLEGLGMTSKEFIDASVQNQSQNELSQSQKDLVYKSYFDDVGKIRTDYKAQQAGFQQAKTALAQGGKGSYAAVVSFLKGLDGSVVKEGEYKAFTQAGISVPGKVEKWITEGYTGDIPKSVKENFGALIDELKKTSDDLYKKTQFDYASLIDADNSGLGATVLDPQFRGEYKTYVPSQGQQPQNSTNDDDFLLSLVQ